MIHQSLPPLLALPAELVCHILAFLPSASLVNLARTCRLLCSYANDDRLWYRLVQENVPVIELKSPSPCSSFKDLYAAFHPCWFLPRNKLWFSDSPHTGRLIIARYNPRQCRIEGYRLLAEHGPHTLEAWEWDEDVLIHAFEPRVGLWRDDPIFQLDVNLLGSELDVGLPGSGPGRLEREFQMQMGSVAQGIHSLFFFARQIPPPLQDKSMVLWPPRILPATQRVRNESSDQFRGSGHKPHSLAELSDSTFRIRKWMEFTNMGQPAYVRMGEDVTTWSTLPEECYTPTKEKPWQGIWVGDYSGHGCEFLVVLQSKKHDRHPVSRTSSTSSSASFVSAVEVTQGATNGAEEEQLEAEEHEDDEETCMVRLEAIKLTGDPNIPRGEYTWIAEDIGRRGLIRIAEEPIFKGARVVRSMGHVAGRFFRDDEYIRSQLIMISHDRLAQYWEDFGHVSFYQRVNIDQFLHVEEP